MSIFWIIISYLLGSVPCGYLISAGLGKNVLQVGWKKTSGSNVFKNVGKLAGVATGLLDVAKGFLAVYLAQKLGLSVETQVLSGLAAIIGHNWSLFLGFAGGRGIGTLGGVLLAFSPTVFLLTVAFLVAIALIWDAAIGTLLSLILIILFLFIPGK